MAAMGMPVAVYLPRFYTEGMGLSLVTVGAIFTLARIWDVITDPVMGIVIDKFDTRWGRRKHWIAISIPILVLSVWMVFMPNQESVSAGYLLFWLIVLYVGYTMLAIAHQSWGAELALTYDDRSRLFGWREIFVIAGMTVVLGIPATLELTGMSSQSAKVASMGWFCLILFPLLVVPTLTMVPDTRSKPQSSVPWTEAMKVLASNNLLWRLLAADLASGFGTAVSGALYIFVAATYFKLPEHASIALLFYFLASFLAMPMWLKLAYKVGKDVALKIALLYAVVINLGLIPIAQEGSVVVLWGFTIAFGVAFGAAPTLLRSMMADLTDEDELRSGQKRPGLFFALLTTTNKLGAAFAVGASFAILEVAFGFVPGGDNSSEALDGLLVTYCVGTAFGLFMAFLSMLKYPLDRTAHDAIRRELERRQKTE
ncbi:MAG: MFS transporter [Pseudomonadales bacterium]|nr:MFS transporter [Pseudomonadales bacterium]MDG0999454.1 MFS transporter [Pseudomonadales bacterium]MDG1304086.1 MFS transporter [Pseudomonadales bacterium]|tara:strand:- start:1327 stop:2607 length:1281 start_codon:yes stop_codon:yes gene_type:complete